MRSGLPIQLSTVVLIFLFDRLGFAAAEPRLTTVPELPTLTRGQTVTVKGSDLPTANDGSVSVLLRTGKEDEKTGNLLPPLAAMVSSQGDSVAFKVPTEHFEPGRYLVYVKVGRAELAVPGELDVLPDEAGKVQLDAIAPTTVYPNGQGQYRFEISGVNLGRSANDNQVQVLSDGWIAVGTGPECPAVGPEEVANQRLKLPCLHYDNGMEGRKLTVWGYTPKRFGGAVQVRLLVGNNRSEPLQVTFSQLGLMQLRVLAAAVALFVALMVLWLVWKGVGAFKIDGEHYRPLAAFFLDKETNTYSLSKFQLLVWTCAAVFAYIFVYFCHLFVQGTFDFPAVPSGWPTLLGLSAGTTVAAVGITANHGSKGAGAIQPSVADFITTGGVVATDRFQFFVWTLVGVIAFIGLVVCADPATLTTVPDVPTGFLYLMGISASGYLGGKLVRAPGPVISQLLVTDGAAAGGGTSTSMKITLKGENLSTDATIKVDDDDLRKDQFEITAVKSQDGSADRSMCSELVLTLKEAEKYREKPHTLTVTNRDGQMVVATFPIDPLEIDPLQWVTQGDVKQACPIKGKNFSDGMTAQWTDANGTTSTIPAQEIDRKSDSLAHLQLVPGTKTGEGKLVLFSAIKLRASASVKVIEAVKTG